MVPKFMIMDLSKGKTSINLLEIRMIMMSRNYQILLLEMCDEKTCLLYMQLISTFVFAM